MSPTVFDFFDLPDPTRRGFVVTAKEDNLSDTIPDFLDTTVLWSDCPAWVKKAFEVRGDFQSYRLVYAKKSGYQLRSFYFAPPITTEEAETPFRTYYETEPSGMEISAAKRIAELEAQLSEIHASTRRMSFENEWYLDGLRNPPGDYVLMRVGPVTSDETPF